MAEQGNERTPVTNRSQRALDHVLAGARLMLILYVAISAVIFLAITVRSLSYPYPIDYGEGPLLDQALRISNGENIYLNTLTTPPYTVTNYTPVYMLLWGVLTGIVGPSYLAGRLISVVSTLAISYFLYKLILRLTEDNQAAVISAGLFLNMPYVMQWASLARVDLLALAFSIGSLYYITIVESEEKNVYFASALLIASVYTRQSYAFAAPLTAFVFLFARNRRMALRLAMTVFAGGLALYGLLNLITAGGFHFSVFTITVKVNTSDIETLNRYVKEILIHFPGLLILSLGFLIFWKKNSPTYRLVTPYLIASILIGLTIAKSGSNVNYLLEFCAALSLMAGAVISWKKSEHRAEPLSIAPQGWKQWGTVVLKILIVLGLTVQVGYILRFSLAEKIPERVYRFTERADMEYILWQIEQQDDPLLSDEYMGLLPLMNHGIYLQNFELTKLANAGIWNQDVLVGQIATTDFSQIYINRWDNWDGYLTRWTPDMFSAIQQSYIATDLLGNSVVFEPYSLSKHGPRYPDRCEEAPWIIPTDASLGIQWLNRTLAFNGMGYPGELPVVAAANGVLLRPSDWHGAVAIRHEDPLNPERYVWSYYGGMSLNGETDLISNKYVQGSETLVAQGDIIGYQGNWDNGHRPVHVLFAILPEVERNTFPAFLLDPRIERPESVGNDIQILNPEPYIGIADNAVMGRPVWIPSLCAEQ